jgi:DNA-binding MarR family transcriptional regulator
MLRKLADAGEIREDQGAEDRRHKSLSLTDKGRQTVGRFTSTDRLRCETPARTRTSENK